MSKATLLFCLLVFPVSNLLSQQKEFPKHTGPYLGQKPPGITPEIFAPGIISSINFIEDVCTWSPDLKEFYFSRSEKFESEWTANFAIWYTREVNGIWIEPRLVPFSGVYRDFCPFVTRDGKYMIFYRMNNEKNKTRQGSWITEKIGEWWSEPIFFVDAYCLNTNDFNTFYFTTEKDENGTRDIGFMLYENGKFSEKIKLKGELNTKEYEAHGVISPNGEYILFDGDDYTLVSFKQQDGTWSRGISLNAFYYLPSFSPDGKYIFFKKDRDIYWVSTRIIDEVKPKE
ncbi:MAG: hypothetical protein A2V66_16070 [Ignavibacteria bacterium RBG_13_36_8]|nr:MAG: hypothetical protein A2V66_16070 [Ignavibacteria bacterium RBG_13_36_8]